MLTTKISENGGRAPEAIPYMPAGLHYIHATVNGKGGRRAVLVDEGACARLQADLEGCFAQVKAGKRARPVIYFDHRPGAAAGHPKRFVWCEGKGILLEMADWTAAGRAAVEGGNYGYVSPAFRMGRDSHAVLGLAGGVEVASLVNDPAFEEIDCIAASRLLVDGACPCNGEVDFVNAALVQAETILPPCREVEKELPGQHNGDAPCGDGKKQRNNMNDELLKLLGLPDDADASAVCAAVKKILGERDAHRRKADEAQAESKKKEEQLQAAKADAAAMRVNRLVAGGLLAPKDEERIEAARNLAMGDPAAFDAVFAGHALAGCGTPVVAGKVPPVPDTADMSLTELLDNEQQ